MSTPITVAFGDGASPELMDAVLYILREADAPITIETIEIGERIYNMQEKTGILPLAWDKLIRTRILLKAPTAQPPEGGYRPCGEVIRESFELNDAHRTAYTHEAYGSEPIAHGYINEHFALFEATHDTCDKWKGKDKADPSPLLFAAIGLLRHIDAQPHADNIENAWTLCIADGFIPHAFPETGKKRKKLGTQAFAEKVASYLGKIPSRSRLAGV